MTNSEYARKYYSDTLLAMLFLRENTDCFGRRVYYGDFEGTTLNYMEAVKLEEAWLQQEKGNKDEIGHSQPRYMIDPPCKEHSKVNGEYADWIVYFRLEKGGEIYSKFFDDEQKADEFLGKIKGEKSKVRV